jgi:hypothetical protein
MKSEYYLSRHSGAGRNPARIVFPRGGQLKVLSRLRGRLFNQLDSGLRRITSDLPACGLSRMASCFINDAALTCGLFA